MAGPEIRARKIAGLPGLMSSQLHGMNRSLSAALASLPVEKTMPSPAYTLFASAIARRTPILCHYEGHRREICPIIVGHSDGQEKALVWQYGGETSKGRLRTAEWKCFALEKVRGVEVIEGVWQAGLSHRQSQSCVKQVDYDANPSSPYNPRRSLGRKF